MKRTIYMICAASMVFAASCAKEQMPVVENTDNVVLKTFTADLADADTKTGLPGVFAVGDVRTTLLRQIVTAVADGAVAAHQAEEYLSLF